MKFCYVDRTVAAVYATLCVAYVASLFGLHLNPAEATEQTLQLSQQGLNALALLVLLGYGQWTHRRCQAASTLTVGWSLLAALSVSMLARLALGLRAPDDERFTSWDAAMGVVSTIVVLSELFFTFVRGSGLNVLIFALGLLFVMPALTSIPRMLGNSTQVTEELLEDGLEASWNAYLSSTVHDEATSTQALLEMRRGVLYVAFRGTQEKRDVRTDAKLLAARIGWLGDAKAKVHKGFLAAYDSIRARVTEEVTRAAQQHKPRLIVFTGHSLGGALAVLAATDYTTNWDTGHDFQVYTYGAPQVGDQAFATLYNSAVPASVRVVNPHDKIPASLGPAYVHVKGYYPVTSLTKDIFPLSHELATYRVAINRSRTASTLGIVAPGTYLAVGAALLYAWRRFV